MTTIRSSDGAEERRQRVDSVTLAVIANRLESIVRVMQETLVRSGRSSVLNTARDCSCCILTASGDMLAMAESLPIHVVAGPDMQARIMSELHSPLARGDCYLDNSPYMGNSHAADHSVLAPVMAQDGRHMFTVFVKAHQADCGNATPTTYSNEARDVYEEGAVIFPCVQIQRDFEDRADIVRMCRARIRVPDQWWGDYLAMVGALRMGERRLEEFAAEVGWDLLALAAEEWLAYSERRMRAAIRELPQADVEREVLHDPAPGCPDGIPVRARVAVDPDAGAIEIDLRSNIDCVPCGLNLTEATTTSGALVGVFNSLDPTVPRNAGSARCVSILMRENSCIGIPRHPASCSVATSNLADRLAGVVQSAVAEIRDGLGMAEGGSAFPGSCSVISGRNPNRGDEPFITQLFFAWTGGAARPHADGWLNHSGVVDGGALQRDSVELTEMRYPVVVKEQRLMPDSEGAGRTVGAPSARFEFAAVDAPVEAMYGADGCVHPPAGVRGGLAGGAGAQYRRLSSGEVVDESAFARVTLEPGESLISISAGGGGYGHPWLRDPAQVAADVQEGRISPERARAVYAVALEGDGTVEDNETRRLRSQAGSDPS